MGARRKLEKERGDAGWLVGVDAVWCWRASFLPVRREMVLVIVKRSVGQGRGAGRRIRSSRELLESSRAHKIGFVERANTRLAQSSRYRHRNPTNRERFSHLSRLAISCKDAGITERTCVTFLQPVPDSKIRSRVNGDQID